MYYNTRDSKQAIGVSPTVITQNIEEDESRYEITDDLKLDKDNHDYTKATSTKPPIQDVYAVPNKRQSMRGNDDVTIVDNDIYTDNHGYLTPYNADNDVTIVDNDLYTVSGITLV